MLSPLSSNEPRTRPTPASQRSENASFAEQRRANDLKHREEAVADERARLGEERRALARERAAFEAERDERLEQQRVEQHTEQRRTEAEAIAGDLGHDMDANRPGYVASQILAASRKARGLDVEEPSGLAAEILRAGAIARGEVVADAALPENPTARAVILAGRRAGGETLSAGDEAFLSDYLEKMRR